MSTPINICWSVLNSIMRPADPDQEHVTFSYFLFCLAVRLCVLFLSTASSVLCLLNLNLGYGKFLHPVSHQEATEALRSQGGCEAGTKCVIIIIGETFLLK